MREILNPLINLPTEFAESKYVGETCMICGFPFDKKVREKAVDQALAQIKKELLGKLPKEKMVLPCIDEDKDYDRARVIGFNDCLSQAKQVIDLLFK